MKSNNQINIPEAKAGMEQFKQQAANEVGVNLSNGCNGNLTSREAGSMVGQMVKKMCPVRNLSYIRNSRVNKGYLVEVRYIAEVTL